MDDRDIEIEPYEEIVDRAEVYSTPSGSRSASPVSVDRSLPPAQSLSQGPSTSDRAPDTSAVAVTVIRCLSQCVLRKSKNRYFYHIFVSPGDAPGAITLNVVWMESRHFIIPPCIRRPH